MHFVHCGYRRSTAHHSCNERHVLVQTSTMLKPPLKWAGGKRWLVSHLKPIWEANAERRYVEPFCGGLAVVLGLQPKQALLNDVNPHLINFYRHVQNGLEVRVRMRNDEELFYRQ